MLGPGLAETLDIIVMHPATLENGLSQHINKLLSRL